MIWCQPEACATNAVVLPEAKQKCPTSSHFRDFFQLGIDIGLSFQLLFKGSVREVFHITYLGEDSVGTWACR